MDDVKKMPVNKLLKDKLYLLSAKENSTTVRVFSFLLALIFSVIILFNPHFIASTSEAIQHGILSVQMLAISCGFIHGIGFSAKKVYFKLFLSPFIHWPIMLSLLI